MSEPLVTVVDHPLVKHKLTLMRRKETSTASFRALCTEISMLLAYEATRDMKLTDQTIETPLATIQSPLLEGKKVVLIGVLRAGLGILDGMLELMPSARVGHIGMYRDPATLKPVEYFYKVPSDLEDRAVLVCDPMLATGNSLVAAVARVKLSKPSSLKVVCLLACPEGLKTFHAAHPDVPVITAAVDEKLNDHGYIVPGLGDAGDRLFGTRLAALVSGGLAPRERSSHDSREAFRDVAYPDSSSVVVDEILAENHAIVRGPGTRQGPEDVPRRLPRVGIDVDDGAARARFHGVEDDVP